MKFSPKQNLSGLRLPGLRSQGVLMSLFLTACMQSAPTMSGDRPDWVSAEAAQYPNSQYVTANGSAGDPERAKDRALANLAKVFELRIRESSTALQNVESQKRDGNERVTTRQSLFQNIQTDTDKIIDGARVAEQWYDKADLTHYALAVLDRRQAGNNIRSEIQKFDEETQHELSRVEQSIPLQQVGLLNRAMDLQTQRSALQKTLKVIDLSGRGVAARWNLSQLREQLESSLLQLNMALAIRNDGLGDLANLVSGAMGKAGFAAKNSGYDYILTASFDAQPTFEKQGWHWLRGVLSLQLNEASGRVMGNKTWPLKVSSVQPELLLPRARAEVERLLDNELKPAVLGFAAGE